MKVFTDTEQQVRVLSVSAGSPVSGQPVIMAAPPHPTVLPSGPGKALALVPGGGGHVQPIPVLQNLPQSSVTMVRLVTSNPLNGYSAPSIGVTEGSSDVRGTGMFPSVLMVHKWCFTQLYVFQR